MKTNAEYMARRFSLTDSTLVVAELSPSDANYSLARLPVTLRLDDVQSIARVESNNVVPIGVIGVCFLLVVLVTAAPHY